MNSKNISSNTEHALCAHMCVCVCVCVCLPCSTPAPVGEEALTIFVDKRKLSRTADPSDSNSTAITLETLHQLAASYFIDRESTLRRLHHLQIASTAIKVTPPGPSALEAESWDLTAKMFMPLYLENAKAASVVSGMWMSYAVNSWLTYRCDEFVAALMIL